MTGYFFENGTFNGEPAYERMDGGAWLWFDSISYYLTTVKGDKGALGFANETLTVVPGNYSWYGTATGDCTVEAVIE